MPDESLTLDPSLTLKTLANGKPRVAERVEMVAMEAQSMIESHYKELFTDLFEECSSNLSCG